MFVPLLSLTSTPLSHFVVVSKVQMLEEGVGERIEALLRSESPPVQFRLLGTLRTLADGQGRHLPVLPDISLSSPPPLPCKTGCARLQAECPANPVPLHLESFQQRLLPEAARFPDCPSQPQRWLRNKPHGTNLQQSVRTGKGLRRCFSLDTGARHESDEKEPGFNVKSQDSKSIKN